MSSRSTLTSCIEWCGEITENGYGRVRVGRRWIRVHRLAYEAVHGAIPDGLQIDHLCRNRACMNPEHLEAVTPRENTLRGIGFAAINAKKTHCPVGHALTPENTYITNGRQCKTCTKKKSLARYYGNHKGSTR